MYSVTVQAASKKYYVHIGAGLLGCVGELSANLRGAGRAMVVSDSNVAPLYASTVMASLSRAGFSPELHTIEAGEPSKNFHCLFALLNSMANCRMTRGDMVFALGGGVVGDLAGLAASLYMRGVGLVQLPTSLLAAVDSSVGGKTAIDLDAGKNLAGSFYQPDLVLCDTDALATLPPAQLANGFGEIIKTGAMRDARLFDAAGAPGAPRSLPEIVRRCVEIKSEVVRLDEKEKDLRQILNFGHTFGHAVEKLSGFSIPHGFCVSIGMSLVTAASEVRGICLKGTTARLTEALKNRGLPVVTDYGADELFDAMMADKKRVSDSLTLILPLGIGSVERRRVSLDEAKTFLADGLEALRSGKAAPRVSRPRLRSGSGMSVTIVPSTLNGVIAAIPSKSNVHRLLICAALADRPSTLACRVISEDILATARCLASLGAGVEISDGVISVTPVSHRAGGTVELDPGESGSTYRFFTPLAQAVGHSTRYTLHGKLPKRPMEPLWSEMERLGVAVSGKGTEHPRLDGALAAGEYRLRGDISSQYFTGLLFALPLLDGDSRIRVEGHLESAGYIDMTLESLAEFSVKILRDGHDFIVPGKQKYTAPASLVAEGDWSNSAFWLCAGAARGSISVTGLKDPSTQGDSASVAILRAMGANVHRGEGFVFACAGGLRGSVVDVAETPDLVPALAVTAAAANGTTRIVNAGRLRLKESDRIESVCAAIRALGGHAEAGPDSITIEGTGILRGGTVDACGDHRIAMMGAAASVLCREPVTVTGAEAVNKSYPGFFDDFAALGGIVIKGGV